MKTREEARNRMVARRRRGSSLITVMFVITITSLVAGSLYTVSSSMTGNVRTMADRIRAKAIAEAGANAVYSALRTDYDLRNKANAFPMTEFEGGSYAITLTTDDKGGTRVLSVGRYRHAEARVGLDMRDANHADSGVPEYLEYAIFSNGDLRFNGTPPYVEGNLHTNNDWTLNGSYDNVDGKISAQNSDSIPVAYRADWQVVPFPQLSDPEFQAFLADAEAQGILTWYNGDQTFQGSSSFSGVVVVDGNLTFNGSGDRTVDGMLYVVGNVTANGSGSMTLDGVLLSGGNITFNGASGMFDHNATSSDPNAGEDPEPHVVVSGWWED